MSVETQVTQETYVVRKSLQNVSGTTNLNATTKCSGTKSISDDTKATIDFSEEPADSPSFFWTYQEEPHRTRRKEIIKSHPSVTKLCGHEPLTKYVVLMVLFIQFTTAYLLRNTGFWTVKFWLCGYIIGATANQNIFLAIHELSHNLGFKKPVHNQLFSILTNLPISIPYSAGFGPYHQLHHKYLGDSKWDTDLPTQLEAIFFDSVAGKAFFATFQIFFYAVRPICVAQIPFGPLHALNIVVQVIADIILVKLCGWNSLLYLLLSSFLAGSLHPCAGHFIAEHYVLDPPKIHSSASSAPPPETYSYYGPLNLLTYNVGYHNEHHDFPFVAWTKLPALRAMASEFYDPLPSHSSWVMVLLNFILDERVSLWCRVKRAGIGAKR